jgi:hypothetical protein
MVARRWSELRAARSPQKNARAASRARRRTRHSPGFRPAARLSNCCRFPKKGSVGTKHVVGVTGRVVSVLLVASPYEWICPPRLFPAACSSFRLRIRYPVSGIRYPVTGIRQYLAGIIRPARLLRHYLAGTRPALARRCYFGAVIPAIFVRPAWSVSMSALPHCPVLVHEFEVPHGDVPLVFVVG